MNKWFQDIWELSNITEDLKPLKQICSPVVTNSTLPMLVLTSCACISYTNNFGEQQLYLFVLSPTKFIRFFQRAPSDSISGGRGRFFYTNHCSQGMSVRYSVTRISFVAIQQKYLQFTRHKANRHFLRKIAVLVVSSIFYKVVFSRLRSFHIPFHISFSWSLGFLDLP